MKSNKDNIIFMPEENSRNKILEILAEDKSYLQQEKDRNLMLYIQTLSIEDILQILILISNDLNYFGQSEDILSTKIYQAVKEYTDLNQIDLETINPFKQG